MLFFSKFKINTLNKAFIALCICILPLCISGQEIHYPDSLVLKTLDGKRLNKQQSEYDNEGNELLRLYSVWNQLSHTWRPLMEYTYEYDTHANILLEEAFVMDSVSNQWSGISKYTSLFDNQGSEIKKFYYSWNGSESDWTTNYKYEAEFDKDGRKIKEKSYFGDQNRWVEYQYKKYEYKYDRAGNCVRMHIFELDPENIKSYVKPRYEYIYEYDDRGNLLSSSLHEPLDEYQWLPKNRFEYEYDSDGNRTLETFYTGDDVYGDWNEYYKYGHEYDNGRLTSLFFYYWNKEISDWAGKYNYLYEYDEMQKPVLVKLHTWNNDNWVLNEIGTYYYPQLQPTTVTDVTSRDDKVVVSSNMLAKNITISGAENAVLTIADMQGRIIYTKKSIKEHESIQTASWTTGAYIVSLLLNEQRISRKVLVSS